MSTDPRGGARPYLALGTQSKGRGFAAPSRGADIADRPAIFNGSYEFLIGSSIDRATLHEAQSLALDWGVAPHEVLIALGKITVADYAWRLGEALGLEVATQGAIRLLRRRPSLRTVQVQQIPATQILAEVDGRPRLLIDCMAFTPGAIALACGQRDTAMLPPILTTRQHLIEATLRSEKKAMVGAAVWGHARNRPAQSAAFGVPLRQALMLAVVTGLTLGAAMVVPGAAIAVSTALLTLPFLAIVGLRSASLPAVFRRTQRPNMTTGETSDAALPTYTVLVALYREAAVLAQIVSALSRFDYPGVMAQTPLEKSQALSNL